MSNWQNKKDHPVTQLKWHDAQTYCQWLNDVLKGQLPSNYALRLPSEAEWEKAARGVSGNLYPWGSIFDPGKCNSSEGGKGTTTHVGLYSPQGDSPYGCADMSGNVWEWTRSLFKPYPYNLQDGHEAESLSGRKAVLRGGSSSRDIRYARCACRYGSPSYGFLGNIGFRLVVSPFLS